MDSNQTINLLNEDLISSDHQNQNQNQLIPTDDSLQFDSNDYSNLQLPTQSPLTHEIFRSEDFNPDEFLLSKRHTSLNELRIELRTYLNDLKFELVGLINEDYEDFIGLGMGLRGTIERSMIQIKKPIEDCKDQIFEIKQKFEDQKLQLENLLNERRKVIDGKNLLKLMLECHEAVCKVEEMLLIKSNNTHESSSSPTHHSLTHHPIKSNHHHHLKFNSTKLLNDSSFDDQLHFIQEDTKRIERIVFEFNQMLYLVSKASDLNYVLNLKPRIDQITQVLHRQLDSLLKNILLSPKSDVNKKDRLMGCLRAYETLGAVKEAEELIKQELVLPGLRKLIHQNSLNSGSRSPVLPRSPESTRFPINHPPSSPSSSKLPLPSLSFTPLPLPEDPELVPLPLMYNKILAFITRDLHLVIDIADRQISGIKNSNNHNLNTEEKTLNPRSKSYEVLINSIISPILQSISNTLGPQNLFASGNPMNFHRNYSTTTFFLNQLESLCFTNRQLISLRSNSDWIEFKNRWQTAVYAQIRTKETIGRVEEGLADGKADASAGSGYLLRATETIGMVLKTLWREDVFLVDLTHRFWRLTLMTLSRYSTWISVVTVPFISSTTGLAAPSNQSSNHRSSSDFNRLTGTSNSRPTITRPSTPLGGGNHPNEELSEDESLKQMSRIMSDIGRLESNVIEFFKKSIEPKLPRVIIGPNSLTPEDILMGILEKSTKFIPELNLNTSNILIKRSSEKLRLIRSIGSTVRLNKKLPNQFSYFIPEILKPLHLYVEKNQDGFKDETLREIKKMVIEEVGNRYWNILLNLQKSEESLKKLKKGKKGFSLFGSSSSAAGNGPSKNGGKEEEEDVNEMNVKVQIRLDVNRFVEDLIGFGFRVEEFKCFVELMRMVEG